MDLKKIQKKEIKKMTDIKVRDSSNEEIESFLDRKRLLYNSKLRKKEMVDFDHPIFSSHNTNSHKYMTSFELLF